MSIEFEKLHEVLENSGFEVINKELPPGEFNRCFEITIDNITYIFEWYNNVTYIHINKYGKGAKVVCDNVEISNTWPNRSFMNIQCEYYNKVVFIIPLQLMD